ncbi:SusC/RagA family TonB-linked outer membrane protein [Pedobacter glucosidilyticus]|uniref:SusC/RagA family TonB-linked outer membrane protein n=1 Tax=Pedobacter glucosidilyticus TaxID=1122941 RepID=UPI0026F0DE28|nr:TonB-dependent receptor [Pedobacter glucosidilyticus]
MKRLLLMILLIYSSQQILLAQDNVEGRVISKTDRLPLPGISVKVLNTTNGVVTNTNGNFSIKAAGNAVLVFSGVGFKSLQIPVNNRKTISVELEDNISALDEVVVVGFGTQSRKTLTGSVSKVKGEDIAAIATPNFQNSLQGLAPGLNVTGTSGMAGAPARIRVRGSGSIFSNGEPLYIIDGIPVESDNSGLFGNTGRGGSPPANPMANIDADEIESVEILKDAAASAIYGARAANGVILITTKKGKSGVTKFSANVSYGVNNPTNKVSFANGNEFLSLREEAIQNSINTGLTFNGNLGGVPPDFVNGGYSQFFANAIPSLNYDENLAIATANQNINHLDDVFRKNGANFNAGVSASGGSDKTQFFTSLNYAKEDGILQRNDFERISGRVNLDHTASSKLKLGAMINGSYTKNNLYPIGNPSQFAQGFSPGGFFNAVNSVLPIFPRFNADGTLFGVPQSVNNLVFQDELLFNSSVDNQRFLSNIYAEYKILKSLTFRSEVGNDYINQINRFYMNPAITPGGELGTIRGVNDFRTRSSNTINSNNFFTFKQSINNEHNFDLVVGNQYSYNNNRSAFIQSTQLPSAPSLNTTQVAGLATSQDRLDQYLYLSFFSRLNYNYKSKYIFSASFRRDGSSRFGANNRWANFPSLSAGWNVTDEDFLSDSKWLSNLKLRASWGLTGNSNPGGVEAISYGGFGVGNAFYGGQIGHPLRRIQALAENIRWERTAMTDLAADFGLFDNRITGSYNYYIRNTTDLILGAAPSPTSGILGGRNYRNAGALKNWGHEVQLGAKVVNGKAFNWNINVNVAYNQNEVTDLGGLDPSAVAFGVNRVYVGMPLGTYYLPKYLGVDPTTGFEVFADVVRDNAGAIVFDARGNKTHDVNRRIVVDPFGRVAGGTTTPNVNWDEISAPITDKPGQANWTGGVSNTFSFKQFTLSTLFTFSLGNWIYDAGAQSQAYMLQGPRNVQSQFLENRWTQPGDNATNPGFFFNPTYSGQATTRFLYKGDYARLRNLRLSYDLPTKLTQRAKINRASIFLTATNLLTFTDFPGWDPEISGTITFQDFNNQPQNIAPSQTNADPPQARNFGFGFQLNF